MQYADNGTAKGYWSGIDRSCTCESSRGILGASFTVLTLASVTTSAEGEEMPEDTATSQEPYTLTISRLTIDKLGVKLYDKASAVVAELISNAYDADATECYVELPLGTELASKDPTTAEPIDKGLEIVVKDNGHGMTPDEARAFYLKIGQDRREHVGQGPKSRFKKRPVMGRKGIGKLAPFGICRRIEVLSCGGDMVPGQGFITTHFYLDFDSIVQDTDEAVLLETGQMDGIFQMQAGTTVRLTSFLPKRVPDSETFHRQLATRFALSAEDFAVYLRNTRVSPPQDSAVEECDIPYQDGTWIDVSEYPVIADGETLQATGWIAMARDSYKSVDLSGIRIYARGKLAARTRDFDRTSGFTGEFTMRSYLVGEIHADWLDDDDGEDLVQTDRQSILWDSDRGQALQRWGAGLITKVAAASRQPRREKKSALFMQQARLGDRAEERYHDQDVVKAAVDLGRQIGAFADMDEMGDPTYVEDLTQVILSVAPHQALVQAFQRISKQQDATIDELISLFGKARLAEMASYGQMAAERVRSIKQLQDVIAKPDVVERDLQRLIAAAPWLIQPDWSLLTQNRPLTVFRDRFVEFWKRTYGEEIEIAVSYEKKQPDFTLIQHGRKLHIVEIKKPGHLFDVADFSRLENYVEAFEQFFAENQGIAANFPERWVIHLIADGVNVTDRTARRAFESLRDKQLVVVRTWTDFLAGAVAAHEAFLDVYEEARSLVRDATG